MSTTPNVWLEVQGHRYGGWTKISLTRSLEQVAGSFDLDITERHPDTPLNWDLIQAGDACRVLIGSTPVLTGYVDRAEITADDKSHTISVSGRDKTCDLVDCCPPSQQIEGASLLALAQRWAALFGIGVINHCKDAGKEVPGFKTEEGSTCHEMLERLARANAVWLTTDGQGNLVITRAGTKVCPTSLELGKNVLKASFSVDTAERFSQITVKGQSGDGQGWEGASAAHDAATASDPAIRRYRPLILIAEQESFGTARQRAAHEVSVRTGKSYTYTATVNGWDTSPTTYWEPNQLVSIRDKLTGLDCQWLLVSVTLTMDDNGCAAELTLHPKEAFDLLPENLGGGSGGSGGGWNGKLPPPANATPDTPQQPATATPAPKEDPPVYGPRYNARGNLMGIYDQYGRAKPA